MLHCLGRHLLRRSGISTDIVNAADDPEEDEQERKGSCMRVQIHAGNYFLEIRPLFTFLEAIDDPHEEIYYNHWMKISMSSLSRGRKG